MIKFAFQFTVRQFLYLQCSQFGSLRTTTGVRIFDRVTEEYRRRMCEDSFGEKYKELELHLWWCILELISF